MRLPRRSLVAAFHDILVAGISLPLALYLRLGEEAWEMTASFFRLNLAIFMASFVASVFLFRLQREVWRYVSVNELKTIAKVVTLSVLLTYGILFLMQRLEGVPRSLPLLQWMVLGALLSGPRVIYRLMRESAWKLPNGQSAVRVMVVGANDHAEGFIRTLQRKPDMPYQVVAILDRKAMRAGRSLRGVPIHAGLDRLSDIIMQLDAEGRKPQRLILTEEYMDAATVAQLLDTCDALGLSLARLPRLTDFQQSAQLEVRPVAIEDLLGRPQSHHDPEAMRSLIAGKRVLITGAGGSIGSELVRQLAHYAPAMLVLLDNSEFNLYQIDMELSHIAPEVARLPLVADVRCKESLQRIFTQTRPQLVFHAAALKHVPLAEINAEETILTNVFGTQHVAEIAAEHQVEVMVLVSTDKAVHPVNVMGASKRLAEYVCKECSSSAKAASMKMVIVRFGNVLGSTGSVVPLFQEQLRTGGPLTITHPEMERYFMTIREASGLVIQAAALSRHKTSLFILDMGKPVKIVHLAEQMIRLAGYTPHSDIDIIFTGLRPGEKLTEELVYHEEALEETAHPKISRSLQSEATTLDKQLMNDLKRACLERQPDQVRHYLQQLVVDYHPQADTPEMIESNQKVAL